jgi:subtilisin-like proprotein convertase family protein
MPALQSSDQRSYSQRRLVLEVLESRLTPTRAWFESSDLPLHINGSTSLQAEVVVNRSVTIQDIDIWLNLDHAKPDELNLTLISPAGTEIRLITGRGGNATGFHDTIIDDQAQQSLNSTTIISGQRYRPEESLATLENEQAQGAWHLRIQDNNPLDNTGTLYSFWLGITSPPDDHGDSTTNASPLLHAASSLFSESGNIEIAGDHDWFSWTATKDCSIQINLDAANNSSLDTYLTLRNASGESLLTDDDSGPGTNSQLTWQAVTGQTYFIDAKSYGTGTGTYGVRLVIILDDYESTVTTAFPLPSTTANTWAVSGSIETTGDHDWFSWTAAKDCSIQINLDAANNSSLDTYLTLRNASGESLLTDDDSGPGTNSQLTWQAVAGQTYFIDTKSFGTATGTYDVRLIIIQDDYESTAATAFPLPLIANNTWSVSGTIETAGDHDWFSWVAPETGGVQASVIPNIGSQLAPDLVLRNSEGYYLDGTYTSITGGTVSAGFSVTAGQVYYFDIDSYYYYASSTGSIGSYNFTISQIHDDYGDSEANAAPLQQLNSAKWSLSGGIDWETDRDLFLWTAPITGQAFINMNAFSNDSLDSFLTVYDSRHNQLLSNDNHGNSFNSRLFMPVIGGETYHFESSSAQRSLGRYDITLELTQIEPIPTKIQSVNTSVIALPDDVIKHRLFISAAGHYLVYARPVVAKPIQSEFASIMILLDTSTQTDESIFVTDSSGPANSDREQFQRSGRWLEFDALASGYFDIYVHGDGKWTGGYELTICRETLADDSKIYASKLEAGVI